MMKARNKIYVYKYFYTKNVIYVYFFLLLKLIYIFKYVNAIIETEINHPAISISYFMFCMIFEYLCF